MSARTGIALDFSWLSIRTIAREARKKVIGTDTENRPVTDHLERDAIQSDARVGGFLDAQACIIFCADGRFEGAEEPRPEWSHQKYDGQHGTCTCGTDDADDTGSGIRVSGPCQRD